MSNNVNHPDHYQLGGLETIKIIDATVDDPYSFAIGNVLKYVTRAGHKDNTIEDLRKARWYIDHALGLLGEQP